MEFLIIFGILGVSILMICSNISWYYYIFHHRAYKVWKEICKHPEDCQLKAIVEGVITFKYKHFRVNLWHSVGYATIHTYNCNCIFSIFDYRRSQKLYQAVVRAFMKNLKQ